MEVLVNISSNAIEKFHTAKQYLPAMQQTTHTVADKKKFPQRTVFLT